MKSILAPFMDVIKHLAIVRHLPTYFDPHERRLVVQSVVIGVIVWAIVFALKNAVHWLFETTLHWIEHGPSIFLLFVPLIIGSLIVATLAQYRAQKIHYRDKTGHIHELIDVEGDGLERAISLYYASKPRLEQNLLGEAGIGVRWQRQTVKLAFRKWLATLVTLGSGGSGGLEASVVLIGESTAAGLFKPYKITQNAEEQGGLFYRLWNWWRPDEPEDLQTAQLAGIAAAVSTLLGAPFAAAFFATEVMYRRRPIVEKLIYSLISSLVAFFLSNIFSGGHVVIFEIEQLSEPPAELNYYLVSALAAVIISLISIYFGRLRASFEYMFHHNLPNIWQRHLTGAILTGVIAIVAIYLTGEGPALILGPGEEPIFAAFAGELTLGVALIALIAKMLATLTTIGSGGSAGLLVPSIFFGTMVAAALAQVFGYPADTLIVPAMAASLVSIVNVPLAAILFIAEVFGAAYMVPALVTLVVASILAHENPVYRTQREVEENQQIIPGYSIRRVAVPPSWAGQTIIELQIRQTYGLNVIGIVEQHSHEGEAHEHTQLNPSFSTPLELGQVLIVLGEDETIKTFERTVRQEIELAQRQASQDEASS